MEDSELRSAKSQADFLVEQQIRLEEARKASAKAELKREKQHARTTKAKKVRKLLKKIPFKAKIAGGIISAVFLIVFFGIALPLVFDSHQTRYLAESDLEEAVNIQDLSTIEYVYHGIAEKPGKFLWADTIDYRVKYEAHVQAFYDMSEIKFSIDRDNKIVIAYLPSAQMGTPVLDETKFGYLPDRATANMREVLALCREDAENEFNTEAIQAEALESLKNTVEALTAPLLDPEWTLEFADLPNVQQEKEGAENASA